jgi:hypothetical protein
MSKISKGKIPIASNLPLQPFCGKKIKSKAVKTYVVTRRAKLSQNLANAPLDYNAIFVYARLQRSLW